MKIIVRAAAVAATLLLSSMGSTVFAADIDAAPPAGHFEWRSQPTYGPRSPTRAPARVWVGDSKAVAACDCAMMDGPDAPDCVAMPTKRKPASQG